MQRIIIVLFTVFFSLLLAQPQQENQKMKVRRFLEKLSEMEKIAEKDALRKKKQKQLYQKYLEEGTRAWKEQNNYEHAIYLFQRAESLDPLAYESFFLLGKLEKDRKNWARALLHLEESLWRREESKAIREEIAEVHYEQGLELTTQQQWTPALEAFERALTENKKMSKAHYQKGKIFMAQGRASEAETSYQEAVESGGGETEELLEAKKELQQIIQKRQEEAQAFFAKGESLGKEGQWVSAQEYFKKAVELDVKNGNYWRALGNTYLQNGIIPAGVEALFQVVELDPNDLESLERLSQTLQNRYTQTLFKEPEENKKVREQLQTVLNKILAIDSLSLEKREYYKNMREVLK